MPPPCPFEDPFEPFDAPPFDEAPSPEPSFSASATAAGAAWSSGWPPTAWPLAVTSARSVPSFCGPWYCRLVDGRMSSLAAGTGEASGATGISFFSRTSWLSSWVWWTTS